LWSPTGDDDNRSLTNRRKNSTSKPGDKPKPGAAPAARSAPTPASTRWGEQRAKPVTALNVFNLKFRESRRDGDGVEEVVPQRGPLTGDPRTNTISCARMKRTLDELKSILTRLDVEVSKPK